MKRKRRLRKLSASIWLFRMLVRVPTIRVHMKRIYTTTAATAATKTNTNNHNHANTTTINHNTVNITFSAASWDHSTC